MRRRSPSSNPPLLARPRASWCCSYPMTSSSVHARFRSAARRISPTRSAESRWTRSPPIGDHRLVSTQFEIQQPVRDAGGWRVLAPFQIREYRLLIAAVSLSIFAEGMWAVVMALQVIELRNDPAALSLVATCLGVGIVAFLLVGGIAADRFKQRTIIIQIGRAHV